MKFYVVIMISRLSALLSTCLSFMCVMHFVNGAQFLNATLVLATRTIPCYKNICVRIITKI